MKCFIIKCYYNPSKNCFIIAKIQVFFLYYFDYFEKKYINKID